MKASKTQIQPDSAKPIAKRMQMGTSLIGAMIAVFLGLVATSASMSLLASAGEGGADKQLTDANVSVREHIGLIQRTIQGAGANPSNLPGVEQVRFCHLRGNSQNLRCQSNNTNTTGVCYVFVSGTLRYDPVNPNSVEIRTLRLQGGLLEYRSEFVSQAGWPGARAALRSRCTDTATANWMPLNNNQIYLIKSLNLCHVNASSFSSMRQNYSTNCGTLTSTSVVDDRKLIATLQFETKQGDLGTQETFGIVRAKNALSFEPL